MHADRTNRVALILFGALTLAVGAAAMVTSAGAFGSAFAHRTLLANRVSSYAGQHGGWLWPAVAGVALLLALVTLRWVAALLLTTDRAGDIALSARGDQGTTIVRPAALIGALASEISSYHGVQDAKGRIIGEGSDPELVLIVTTSASADLAVLRRRIESEAIAHARHALGQPSLPVRLDLA